MKKHESIQQKPQGSNSHVAYQVLCSRLSVDELSFTIKVQKLYISWGENSLLEIPAGQAWLPATPIYPVPMQLKDHPLLFYTLVAAVDSYILRQELSKSTHIVVSDIVKTLVKVFEYIWLRGYYSVSKVPEVEWSRLAGLLVKGGWVLALEVDSRASAALKDIKDPNLYLTPSHVRGGSPSLRRSFLELIGTNVAGRELVSVRCAVLRATSNFVGGTSIEEGTSLASGMSSTMLLQTLRSINLLADLSKPFGTDFLPINDPYKYSMKNGRAIGRTQNLTPESAAALLSYAFFWIYEAGPVLADLVEELAVKMTLLYDDDIEDEYAGDLNKDANICAFRAGKRGLFLAESNYRIALEALLSQKIESYSLRKSRDGHTSIFCMLSSLFSACFVVISLMNARRKDEVLGGAVGIYANCAKVLDLDLKIYECEFYVEKSIKDYVPFYINSVSFRAVELLERISAVAWGWGNFINKGGLPSGRDAKLFCYPDLISGRIYRYSFGADVHNGPAREFVSAALGDEYKDMRIASHMMRRGYGQIYLYRYEDANLVALAQKYEHSSLDTTIGYVTNGFEVNVSNDAAAVWRGLSAAQVSARAEHAAYVMQELKEAGEEKIFSFVRDVVTGAKNFGGGFSRLVERLYRMLSTRIDYSSLDEERTVEVLGKSLLARGHAPHPYPHATCMAGMSRKSAACSEEGRLARERASAVVCSGCAYSVVMDAHLQNMRREEMRLTTAADDGKPGIKQQHAEAALQNLRRVIFLQERRLGIENEPK